MQLVFADKPTILQPRDRILWYEREGYIGIRRLSAVGSGDDTRVMFEDREGHKDDKAMVGLTSYLAFCTMCQIMAGLCGLKAVPVEVDEAGGALGAQYLFAPPWPARCFFVPPG